MSDRSDDADDSESARFLPQLEQRGEEVPSPDFAEANVADFTNEYGLSDHFDVFQKAAILIRHHDDPQRVPGITRAEVAAVHAETSHKWQQPKILYFTILVCSLGAIQQGWSQTGINGANIYLPTALNLDPNHGAPGYSRLGFLNSAAYLSNAIAGAWLGVPFNDILGRRGAIFLGTLLCIMGNAGSALVPGGEDSVDAFTVWRLVLGLGLGLNASTVSIYAAECAPAYIRGGLAVFWQLFVAFGILLGFIANIVFYNFSPKIIWRLQLGGPVLPSIPLFLLIWYCPESPSIYIKRGQYDYAWPALRRLRNSELQAATELLEHSIKQKVIAKADNPRNEDGSFLENIFALVIKRRNRNALLAAATVMFSQQLCGINVISFYSSSIFTSPGGSILSGLWASVGFGVVNFLGAFPAIWTMDTFGRRRLLLFTLPPMALTLAFTSMSFSIPSGTNGVQFYMMASLIYLFCALYSPGMGPVPCAYSAEAYPLRVREVGMSFSISTTNLWAFVLSLTLPDLLRTLGPRGVFAIYSSLNILAWVLCWLFVRETKGVKLEEMDSVFESSPVDFVAQNWRTLLSRLPGSSTADYRRVRRRRSTQRRQS